MISAALQSRSMQAIEKCCIKGPLFSLGTETSEKGCPGCLRDIRGSLCQQKLSLPTCSSSLSSLSCLNTFDSYTKAFSLFFFFFNKLALRTLKALNINFSDPSNIKLIYNFPPIQNEIAGTDACNLIFRNGRHTEKQTQAAKTLLLPVICVI